MSVKRSKAELEKIEAQLVKRFLAEDAVVWEWLEGHLRAQLAGLVRLAGRYDLNRDTRTLLNGKAATIQEILDRPANLLSLLEEAEKALAVVPQAPYRRAPAPQSQATKV